MFLYGGWPFIQGAIRELRDRLPGMMTLIALASRSRSCSARPYARLSRDAAVGGAGHPGHHHAPGPLDRDALRSRRPRARCAELAKLLPDTADAGGARGRSRADGGSARVGSSMRAISCWSARVRASRRWSGAARVTASVNEAMITGESRPVPKKPGDRVIAGTVNGSGSLRVEVTGTGDRTTLAGIMRLVEQAQSSRSRAQALADRAAFWLTLAALASGAITLVAWLSAGAGPSYAVERLVTVLVIACPHALGLAIPLVIAISTDLGARNGLLVRDRRGLEEARNLDTIVFDKTGTLTLGEHRVVAHAHRWRAPLKMRRSGSPRRSEARLGAPGRTAVVADAQEQRRRRVPKAEASRRSPATGWRPPWMAGSFLSEARTFCPAGAEATPELAAFADAGRRAADRA